VYGSLWHVEENTDGAAAVGNTSFMALPLSTRGAIEWLANNVSGSPVTPQHLASAGNALRSSNGVGKGHYIQSNAGADGAHWSVVSGSVYAGFDIGLQTDTDASSVLMANDVLRGVTNSAKLNRAQLTFDGNMV